MVLRLDAKYITMHIWCFYERHKIICKVFSNRFAWCFSCYDGAKRRYCVYFTPLRYHSQLRLHHLHLLVSWQSELDEPLLVEHPCHLFQNGDAARVVLDQVVVG